MKGLPGLGGVYSQSEIQTAGEGEGEGEPARQAWDKPSSHAWPRGPSLAAHLACLHIVHPLTGMGRGRSITGHLPLLEGGGTFLFLCQWSQKQSAKQNPGTNRESVHSLYSVYKPVHIASWSVSNPSTGLP